MTYTSDSELADLTERFIRRSLPKAKWTHAAHFAVGLSLLSDPALDAFTDMPSLIRTYNEATGVPNSDTDGYHETITMASLFAAEAFRSDYSDACPLHVVLEDLLRSPYGRSDWLLKHWTNSRLFSVEARRHWVEPDRSPLPFNTRRDQE